MALIWTAEAEAAMEKVPFFVRGVARRAVIKAAEAEGIATIDLAFVTRVREQSGPRAKVAGRDG